MYKYKAKVDPQSRYEQGAYDGDTIDLVVDLGFKLSARIRVRLLEVNTPELKGDTRIMGAHYRNLTRIWLRDASLLLLDEEFPLRIETEKADSFGRYLAYIKAANGACLSQYLIHEGSPKYERKKR